MSILEHLAQDPWFWVALIPWLAPLAWMVLRAVGPPVAVGLSFLVALIFRPVLVAALVVAWAFAAWAWWLVKGSLPGPRPTDRGAPAGPALPPGSRTAPRP